MSLLSRIIHDVEDAVERIVKGPMTKEAVERALDHLEKQGPERLSWRTSLVDLLKVLGLPTSMEDRAKLAHELGFGTPARGFSGSAADNEKLREMVMEEVAARYIKIPESS